MTILRELSVIFSLLHVLVLFAFLFESRFSRRKTVLLTLLTMGPLGVAHVILFIALGPEVTANLILLTCTFPSLIFFYVLAKKRDGRFFFTFCLADTVSYWIIFVTSILDYYCFGNCYIFMFLSRFLLFPLMEYLVWHYLRRPYLEMQQSIQKGWWIFAGISMLFYVLMVVMSSVPTIFHQRPQELPAIALVLVLMPLMYGNIFYALIHQQKLNRANEARQILSTQTMMLTQQVAQQRQSDDRMRIYRHDLRHKLRTISQLLENGYLSEAQTYLKNTEDSLDTLTVKHWCTNPILDAVFSSYFRQAEAAGIRLETQLSITDTLPVDPAELSTVFANALENAINACQELPQPQRFIRCKCLSSPQFMFHISNSYGREVRFNDQGFPVSLNRGHGIGSRSISAFCTKYNAYCEYRAENGVFTLRILL